MLLRDNIYRSIRSSILTCEFQPGQELREQTLAERYRVSRSPIRDSLLRLEYERLVTVLPRQGYRVNPISSADVDDISGLRMLIEPACAAEAAQADDAMVKSLDDFRASPKDVHVLRSFLDHNRRFHRAVAEISNNTRMAAVLGDLLEQFDRMIRFSTADHLRWGIETGLHEHDLIIDAIQAHDADRASQLAYEHAANSRAQIVAAMQLAA